MKFPGKLLVVSLCLLVPTAAQAHRSWLFPSSTVLSKEGSWVSIDAARSNDLFYFDHFPMLLSNVDAQPEELAKMRRRNRGPAPAIEISSPDGGKIDPKFGHVGRFRTTFDVPLEKSGTYKMSVFETGMFARYKLKGEEKRWRGTEETFEKEIPKDAEELQVTDRYNRVETFVTVGNPTTEVLKTTGAGLELEAVTHPNDLYAKETATFKFLLDGKAAAGIKVSVIRGGIRYRDALGEIEATTGEDGTVKVTWPEPGMYFISASARREASEPKGRQMRAGYAATLEVLPQ